MSRVDPLDDAAALEIDAEGISRKLRELAKPAHGVEIILAFLSDKAASPRPRR